MCAKAHSARQPSHPSAAHQLLPLATRRSAVSGAALGRPGRPQAQTGCRPQARPSDAPCGGDPRSQAGSNISIAGPSIITCLTLPPAPFLPGSFSCARRRLTPPAAQKPATSRCVSLGLYFVCRTKHHNIHDGSITSIVEASHQSVSCLEPTEAPSLSSRESQCSTRPNPHGRLHGSALRVRCGSVLSTAPCCSSTVACSIPSVRAYEHRFGSLPRGAARAGRCCCCGAHGMGSRTLSRIDSRSWLRYWIALSLLR